MEDDGLPDIEKERLERIQRNREAMRALGVLDAAERVASTLHEEQVAAAAAAAEVMAKYNPSPGAPARRSSRPASKAAAKMLARAAAAHDSEEEASELMDGRGCSDITSDSSEELASRKRKAGTSLQPRKTGHHTYKHQQQQQLHQAEDMEQEYVPTGSDADEEEASSASEGLVTDSEADEQEQLQQRRKQQAEKRKNPPTARHRASNRTAVNQAAVAAATAGDGEGAAGRQQQQQWVPGAAMDVQLDHDDWELQLALQLSMQDGKAAAAAAAAAAGDADAAAISKLDHHDAVLVSDDEAPSAPAAAGAREDAAAGCDTGQEGQSVGKQQQRGHQKLWRGRIPQQILCANSKQHQGDDAELEKAGEVKHFMSSSKQRARKQSTSKKRGACSNDSDWQSASAADMFDLFALFEPGDNGAISKSHLLQQMAKAGMEADSELAERMLQYAKELAAKQQAMAGQPHAAPGRVQLEYEEFLVLSDLMVKP